VLGASRALDSHLDEQRQIKDLRLVLSDRSVAPDEHLPKTGLTPEIERRLSAAFIVAEGYGTRSTTVCALNGAAGWLEETTYAPDGRECSVVRMNLP
jgi:uncharacterized protein with NRDE domain